MSRVPALAAAGLILAVPAVAVAAIEPPTNGPDRRTLSQPVMSFRCA